MQIVPAILATTEEEYSEKLKKIEDSALFEWVQIDLMDGEFVDNKSITPEIIKKYPTNLKIEVHLMVKDPQKWIDELGDFPINRFIYHIEADPQEIKVEDIEIGLAINPQTPISSVEPYLESINSILVMSVTPGFSGGEFLPEFEKIKEAYRLREENGLDFLIGEDGGVTAQNLKQIMEAGADYVVMGSHLLQGDIEENVENLWEVIRS